jgi:hypothetical protein
MRHFFLFWCVLILYFPLYSQKKTIQIDSAFQILKNTPNSIKKVHLLIDLYRQSIRQKEIDKRVIENDLSVYEYIFYLSFMVLYLRDYI